MKEFANCHYHEKCILTMYIIQNFLQNAFATTKIREYNTLLSNKYFYFFKTKSIKN